MHFNKIKSKLFFVYLSTFTALILIISLIVFLFLKELLIGEIHASRLDVLSQIGERSNAMKNSSITISNLYNMDSQLLKALSEEQEESARWKIKADLDARKKSYDIVFGDVGIFYDVVVIGNNGFAYSSQAGDNYDFLSLKNQLWYKSIYDKKGDIMFISSFRDIFGSDKSKYVFSTSRTMKDEAGEPLAILLVNIDEIYLAKLYESALNGSNSIYIIDSKGNIISHSYKSMRGLNFMNMENFNRFYGKNNHHIVKKSDGDYLLSYYHDDQTGWTIIEETPASVVFSTVYQALYLILAVIILCLLIAILVSWYISGRVSMPILTLCGSMNQVRTGNFDVISDVKGYEEINQLKDSFNNMAREIKHLLEDITKKEAYKRQAELDFLRAQINPHFMYNTLFSIKCQAEIGKNQQVSHMLSAFIDLLKLTLREDTDLISLKEELAVTKKYLILQQVRYDNKFSFEFEPDDDTLTCMVPTLLLQPLVENAIFHGIEAKDDIGMIVISSKIHQERLFISVVDDGVGMSPEAVKKLQYSCEDMDYKSSKSIGIANVSNRIKINFGEEYGVVVTSDVWIGTSITLRLPVMTETRQGADEL